nr:peptide chain release factor N(5)-glutamine methyltransferase [uncultured Sphaerochaeta sp.]
MTIASWKQQTTRLLQAGQVGDSANLDARLLLEKATGLDQVHQIMESERILSSEELEILEELRGQRLAHKPMAYILGYKEFYGRTFLVDEHTLIPRPDTETLINEVLHFSQGKNKETLLPIIDVCTGSGAIGITLSLELNVDVELSDISRGALNIAMRNAITLTGHELLLHEADLLSTISQKYGMIVSNPPYLTATWCDEVSAEVAWEPRGALDGQGQDGLFLIRRLLEQSTLHLKEGGALFIECDYRQTHQVASLFKEHHFSHITIAKDLAGHERVVWGVLTCTNN